MHDDVARDGHTSEPVHRMRIELQRALVFELLQNVLLDLLDGPAGIDDMVVKNFLQRLERVPGLFFERLVSPSRKRLIMVRGAILPGTADSGAPDFAVMDARFAASLQLARHRFLFVHEKNHDVDRRMPEMDTERSVIELAPQRVHLVHEPFQALDLHMRSGKAVENHAMVIFLSQQAPQHQAHDLTVPDHVAHVLQGLRLRRVQQRADDDRRARQAPRLRDESSVGALARTWRAAEKNDLFRETQVFTTEFGLEILPNRLED